MNFVIALAMLGTPFLVKAMIGSGLSAMTGALIGSAAGTVMAAPAQAAAKVAVVKEQFGGLAARARNPSDIAGQAGSRFSGGRSSQFSPPPRF